MEHNLMSKPINLVNQWREFCEKSDLPRFNKTDEGKEEYQQGMKDLVLAHFGSEDEFGGFLVDMFGAMCVADIEEAGKLLEGLKKILSAAFIHQLFGSLGKTINDRDIEVVFLSAPE
jgi:hypothetical protein